MKIHELKSSLEKSYDLVAFVDLSDLREQHRAVFDLFKSIRQDVFNDNQRIVLYSQHKPEDDFLKHITRAASRVDIGEFFILVVCPYELDTSLQSAVYLLEDTKQFQQPKYIVSDTFCPFPFITVSMDQDTRIKPCCYVEKSYGDLKKSDIADEFHNEKITELRQELSTGKKPDVCNVCWNRESKGIKSFRNYALDRYGDQMDNGWLDDIKIRSYNWSPTSLCNFKCRICKPNTSTSIAAEELKFTTDNEHKKILTDIIKTAKIEDKNLQIINSLTDLDELEELHLLGGEPLMWPNLENLIDVLISSGQSKNIELIFTTNGSQYPERIIDKIISHFKLVNFSISVDDTEKRFETTRGGQWSSVRKNIKKFADLRSKSNNVTVRLSTTVNLYNLLYLESMQDFAIAVGLDIWWWYVERPSFLSIDNATQKLVDLVQQKYANHHNNEFRQIARRMLDSNPSDGTKFIQYTNMLDIRRNQNFKETHSELYELMSKK